MNESISSGRSYTNTDINVADCFFVRSKQNSGSGGVFYVSGGSYNMNVSYSMFFGCTSSDIGGAIYFVSSRSDLRMICASKCFASSSKHFGWIFATVVNYVELFSITSCSDSFSSYRPIEIESGDMTVSKLNCSLNKAIEVSGVVIDTPKTFTCSFCTFSNNKASKSICICLFRNSGIFKFVNIIGNNSPTGSGVIYVSNSGSYQMSFCIFYLNQNALFYIFSGSLQISNSMISHVGFTTITNNNTLRSGETYFIEFYGSYYCATDTPNPTIENTIKMTIQRIFNDICDHLNRFVSTKQRKDKYYIYPIIISFILFCF